MEHRENSIQDKIKRTNKQKTPFLTHLSLLFHLCTFDKNMKVLQDNPINILTKFGSDWHSGIREENKNRQQTC